jgi:molybdopterin-containing oxidoreductase family iron-sulfur binding subunit
MKRKKQPDPPPLTARHRDLLTRRVLLGDLVKATLAGAVVTTVAGGCASIEKHALPLLQQHYLDLDEDELAVVVERLEEAVFSQYEKRPVIQTTDAPEGVRWVQTLDLSACVGCGRCRKACFQENNQTRGDEPIYWIEMLKSHHQKIW